MNVRGRFVERHEVDVVAAEGDHRAVVAVVDGVETGEDEILREGQVLNFVKQAGPLRDPLLRDLGAAGAAGG